MNLSLLSGLKEMWGIDEELQDSARKKLDEMDPKTADEKYIKYSPDTIHGKIHKLLEDDIKENNNEYSLYEDVQKLYIIILYFFQKNQENQEKVDNIPIRELHYEEYIKKFPKIENVEMIESEMNTEKVDSYNNMLKYFITPENENIYENMIRDIYVAYRYQGNENEVKCLNLICERKKRIYDLIYLKMRERYISEEMFRGKNDGIESGISRLISEHAGFRRKSRRKSVRKSRRKSVRKSVRKFRGKSR